MLALYSCRRAGRLHNNHNRHEFRVYEYNGKFYLTSIKENDYDSARSTEN